MRNIVAAIAIVLGACTILYLVGMALGLPAEWARGLAGLPLGGIKTVYEFLEARSAKSASAKTGLSPATQVEFSIRPIPALILCMISWCGVILFTGGLTGSLIGVGAANAGVDIAKTPLFVFLIVWLALPLRIIAAAYIGSWIGKRSRSYGLAVLIAGIVLGQSAGFLLTTLTLGNDWYRQVVDMSVFERYLSILPDMALHSMCGALGYWYGQRQRQTYYLTFIMKLLPDETRQTIIAMAREEAMRSLPELPSSSKPV